MGEKRKSINDPCHYTLLLNKYHLFDFALNGFLPSACNLHEQLLIFKYNI